MSADSQIEALGLQLPPAPKAAGVYQSVLVVGDLAYVSGHGPLLADGTLQTGTVGQEIDLEGGYAAARQTGLAMLASLRAKLGTLDRVVRLVKTFGMVNSTPTFTQHPSVINGFSELMRDVFGAEDGVGARSAVGMASLPMDMIVEVEAIFQIR
jgi:enamine deaminase RidA (YjgF/YER057c/UK114 family)